MFTRSLIHMLLSIIFIKESSAYVEIESINVKIKSGTYFHKFEMTLVNPNSRSGNAIVNVVWHAKTNFPENIIFESSAFSDRSNGSRASFKTYSGDVCKHNVHYLPDFLDDVVTAGSPCILEGTERTFQNSALFDVELLLNVEHARYNFPIINYNTLSSDDSIILQYTVTAKNYSD